MRTNHPTAQAVVVKAVKEKKKLWCPDCYQKNKKAHEGFWAYFDELKSRWLKTHGDNFDWKMWKKYKQYLDSGITDNNPNTSSKSFRLFTPLPEIKLFTNNDIVEGLLSCLFPYKENVFDSDTAAADKEKWNSSKYIIKVKVEIEILEQAV